MDVFVPIHLDSPTMKPPLGYCPHKGCGKAGVTMDETGSISCPDGHVYSTQSMSKDSGAGSNQPGEKKIPPTAVAEGGSGFRKRSGNSDQQEAEAINSQPSSPAPSSSPAPKAGLRVASGELDGGNGQIQQAPSGEGLGSASVMNMSDFIRMATELDSNVTAHKEALKHILNSLEALTSEVGSMLEGNKE